MSQLTDIIMRAGVLPQGVIDEMRRWGLPVDSVEDPGKDFKSPFTLEKFCEAIDVAVQGEGYVLTRETDLEAIPQYLRSMLPALLHVVDAEVVPPEDFEVYIGRTAAGEYIIPWKSDSITDLLTNGETYLRFQGKRVFFSEARELFYGDNKAFTVCTPSTVTDD